MTFRAFIQLLHGETLLNRRIRWLARVFTLIVLFLVLFWLIPIKDVVHVLALVKWEYLVWGYFFIFLSIIFSSLEMFSITRHQKIFHGFGYILQVNLAVRFYTQFMPTALIASGIRWFRLAQPWGKRAESLAALAFFRSLDTFITLAVALIFWVLSLNQQVGQNFGVNILIIGLFLLAIPLFWFLITRKSILMYLWLKDHGAKFLSTPFWQPISQRLEKFLIAISAFKNFPLLSFLSAFSAGILSVLCNVFSGVILAWAVGIEIGFFEMGWIQAIITIATQLPFAVAGGVGIREVTLVVLLGMYGVSGEKALALSFVILLRGFLIAIIGGGTEFVRSLSLRPSKNNITN